MTAPSFGRFPVMLAALVSLLAASYAYACNCGCALDVGEGVVAASADFSSRFDFFTNYGEYMPRIHCLRTADGRPDWPWIGALIAMNLVVAAGYLRIFWFWRSCYKSEDVYDRDDKLMQLAWVFALCAACGYGMSTIIFFWPAYRLLAILLVALAMMTWKFALDLDPFRQAFTAHRLQRELNAAMQVEKEDLEELLDLSPVAIVTADEEARIESMNQAAAATFGYTQEEAIGCPMEMLLPESQSEIRSQLEASKHGGPVKRADGIAQTGCGTRKDGQEFPVKVGLQVVERNGRPRIVAAVHDLTETQEAKRAAAESEARFFSIANSSPLCMWVCDDKSDCTWLNECWLRYTGSTLEENQGDRWLNYLHPEDRQTAAKAYAAAFQQQEEFLIHYRLRRHDGSYRWHTAIGVPRVDDEGRFLGYIGVCVDDHDQLEARQRLEELNASLQESEQRALAASRAKSEFLANMSHEIRTPLNAVIGLSEMVLKTELDDVQRDYLTTVASSGEVLLAVINDILDFSKIEAGKLQLDAADFQIRDCVGDVMKSLGVNAAQQQLELAYRIAQDVPQVLVGDPNRLRQVLINLVGNAVKFTNAGHIYVDVRVAPTPPTAENAVVLEFLVEDTGIGISPEVQQQIFTAFAQEDTSTTRKYEGTGLGLAITQRLVEAMGGTISVESEPGQGSTFRFTAQFGRSNAHARQPWQEVVDELAGSRLLVVDDHLINLKILAEMVTTQSMEVVTAQSGAEALELLQTASQVGRPFDLVVTDVHMPEMDGFELARRVRFDEKTKRTPIILLSSSGDVGDAQPIKDLDIASRLLKPVKSSELMQAVVSAFQLRRTIKTPASVEPGRADLSSPQPSLRILLAEDSLPNQKLALAVLGAEGHQTVVVETGQQAVDATAAQEFDVVLMDIQMPEMDGYQATAAIRERDEQLGVHTMIIAMTAHALDGDRDKCLAAGMDGYVSKPVRPEALFAEIARTQEALRC